MRIAITLLGALLSGPSSAFAQVVPLPSSIAIVPDQVPVAPGKTLSREQNLDPGAAYLIRMTTHKPSSFRFDAKAMRSGVTEAALSPSGSLIAFADGDGITVLDLEGRPIGDFPKGTKPRWNQNASMLGMLIAREDPTKEGWVLVWNVKSRVRASNPSNALDLEWGARDTLFLARSDTVFARDSKKGKISPSRHRGVSVSPNGRYSLERDPSARGGYRVRHDRSGRELTACTFGALGAVKADGAGAAFWVRGEGSGRILCVSRSGWWSDRPNQPAYWGARTGIVDVMTSELLFAVPGIAIGPSADGRSAWVYDGYDITLVPFDQPIALAGFSRSRERDGYSAADEVKLRVWWQEWAKAPYPPEERFVTVQEGDFIPTPRTATSGFGNGCEEAVRVIRIKRSNAIEVLVNRHSVKLPGSSSRILDRFEVTRAPVSLYPLGIYDYGYEVRVSVAP